jgi:hypothetical protein
MVPEFFNGSIKAQEYHSTFDIRPDGMFGLTDTRQCMPRFIWLYMNIRYGARGRIGEGREARLQLPTIGHVRFEDWFPTFPHN